jgi:hypothetical protein
MECDEAKGQQAVDLDAMAAQTRQVIAFHVGARSRDSAKSRWAKIPLGYREQATFHTDQ